MLLSGLTQSLSSHLRIAVTLEPPSACAHIAVHACACRHKFFDRFRHVSLTVCFQEHCDFLSARTSFTKSPCSLPSLQLPLPPRLKYAGTRRRKSARRRGHGSERHLNHDRSLAYCPCDACSRPSSHALCSAARICQCRTYALKRLFPSAALRTYVAPHLHLGHWASSGSQSSSPRQPVHETWCHTLLSARNPARQLWT